MIRQGGILPSGLKGVPQDPRRTSGDATLPVGSVAYDRVAPGDVRTSKLPSGLTVVSEQLPSLMSTTVGLWLPVGSRDEPEGCAGFAHLLEHTVFKGAGAFSAFELVDRVERTGGQVNAFTTAEETVLWGRTLPSSSTTLLEVLAAMLSEPHHRASDVYSEIAVVAAESADDLADPVRRAHAWTLESMFADHPLARRVLGPVEGLAADDGLMGRLQAFHRRFWSLHAATLVVVGPDSHEQVVERAAEVFSASAGPAQNVSARTAPASAPTGGMLVDGDGPAAHVLLTVPGLPAGHEDGLALAAYDVVCGAGMSSRLFQRLREDRPLVYSTSSSLSVFQDAGLFHLYASCEPSRAGEVAEAMLDVLACLPTVSAAERERAAAMLSAARLLAGESGPSRMRTLGLRAMVGLPLVSVADELASYPSRLSEGRFASVAALLEGAEPTVAIVR